MSSPAAIGFRAHSGWAAAVAVTGLPDAPVAVSRRRIEMRERRAAGPSQPYHAAVGLDIRDAEQLVADCAASSKICGNSAIRWLVAVCCWGRAGLCHRSKRFWLLTRCFTLRRASYFARRCAPPAGSADCRSPPSRSANGSRTPRTIWVFRPPKLSGTWLPWERLSAHPGGRMKSSPQSRPGLHWRRRWAGARPAPGLKSRNPVDAARLCRLPSLLLLCPGRPVL